MLQVTYIRENKETVIAGLRKRNIEDIEAIIDSVLELDDKKRATQKERDDAQAAANKKSKEIGGLMREGKKEEAEAAKAETSELKSRVKELSEQFSQLDQELKNKLYHIPNVPQPIVPEGKSDEDNVEEYRKGEVPTLAEGSEPHWDLIKKYDIIDFEMGNKVTGAGFPFYKGKGARLQRALVNFFLEKAVEKGYLEVQPPIVVNEASGYGTGQLPDKEGQMYHIGKDELYLIPTAEVPITNMFRDEILRKEDLPKRCVGFTPCFRREAGSWGADVRGLNRLHQFDKVEIVNVTKPEDSETAHKEMCDYVESLLVELGLPYRRLLLCGGDLSINAGLCYDFEVYSAAQERWLEVSSVSNFYNYQANRLKLRYKDENNQTQLAHTLNGSALALPRILAAILENNQTPEGIRIPEVLVPFTGFDMIN
ncbi:serine--tRNA ligase [Sediminitomix flava]|uniref:Serine--tRNA ligase n=1 Tax=Sediminitomix flava TaxID=379075 RepID=A0A315ZH48_SEDFL|nr:serine--tRNA ligase [Sediminitomix flava]PWJ44906.1 seryl-tRNA synthetase [Sediminitomix flava]